MRTVFLYVALLVATTVSAQRLDYLTLRLLNGNEHSVNIASGATITFTDTSIDITTETSEPSLSFALANLSTLFFSATPTGITNVAKAEVNASFNNGALQVVAPAGSKVGVYSLDGRTIAVLKKSTDGNERFSLPLNKGIYVIRVDQQSFKILAQ
jgi:hypothetical protein